MEGFNFTERVRKVLAMAREESLRLNHEYVGTEHMLLSLAREGEGVGAQVLRGLGADLDALAAEVDKIVQPGRSRSTGPDLPYTSRAKKVLELAMKEARRLDHTYVGTEHLLLGLLAEGRGIAAQVLTDAGIDLDSARAEVAKIVGWPPAKGTHTSPPNDAGRGLSQGRAVSQVEIVLHYADGGVVRTRFESLKDAQGFLAQAPGGR